MIYILNLAYTEQQGHLYIRQTKWW